jgi:hypothetical protein
MQPMLEALFCNYKHIGWSTRPPYYLPDRGGAAASEPPTAEGGAGEAYPIVATGGVLTSCCTGTGSGGDWGRGGDGSDGAGGLGDWATVDVGEGGGATGAAGMGAAGVGGAMLGVGVGANPASAAVDVYGSGGGWSAGKVQAFTISLLDRTG